MSSRHRRRARGRLFLLGGNVDRGQRLGAIKHRELARISPVRFDPVARPSGDQSRGNDVAGNALRRQRAVQLEAARPGLVTAAHRTLAL